MVKKIILGLAAGIIVVAGIAAMSAFEAHVINVTAQIENALKVNTTPINFGTVFPQEELDKELVVSLSDSFMTEDRVDDVKYRIRQKPKCAITNLEGTELIGEETKTAHVWVENGEVKIECPEPPRNIVSEQEKWGVLPLLCPYLSKHKLDTEEEQDEELDAFHEIGWIDTGDEPGNPADDHWVWNDIRAMLTKKGGDTEDKWEIDLKVPCFGDYCGQDWADFVDNINPDVDPEDYVQLIEDEHKIFGCDLWIEVTGISLPDGDIGCEAAPDVMLTLDRSGSISNAELALLKTASKAFVDALAPVADGSHIGQSSFASAGSLDTELMYNVVTIKANIDVLAAAGSTDLEAGLTFASIELMSTRDRIDSESPDFMVVITDGAPNVPSTTQGKIDAETAAAAAKATGTTIYVVGVGTSDETANWLKNNIATSPSHYFDVGDYAALQALLEDLGTCE